jgi:hypothetical protein
MLKRPELLSQIDPTDVNVFHNFCGRSAFQNLPIMQDICPIHNIQGLTDVMVGDQNAYPSVFQLGNQITNFSDRDGVNACKRFIQQNVMGLARQTTGNLDSAALST